MRLFAHRDISITYGISRNGGSGRATSLHRMPAASGVGGKGRWASGFASQSNGEKEEVTYLLVYLFFHIVK